MSNAGFSRTGRYFPWSPPVLGLIFVCWSIWGEAAPAGANELRRLDGRYLRLTTDLPEAAVSQETLAVWIQTFDAAVPQWCEFWGEPVDRVDQWRLDTYVMADKERFRREGMIPPTVPDFPHGFQSGEQAWVVYQPSDYYTRHLLLHEGCHGLAAHLFGGGGPPWFMEGTAEMLATHRGVGNQVEVGVIPPSRDETPYWGRFKLLDTRRSEGKSLALQSVLRYSDTAHRQVEPYAWTWAAAQLFASTAETRQPFIEMARQGRDGSPQFTRDFVNRLGDQWQLAQVRWRILLDEFDYGYDLQRNTVGLSPQTAKWNGDELTVNVAADRGWQSIGPWIPAGTSVQIEAGGRVILGETTRPWVSEPGGVTIRYHRGRPLGTLLATVVPRSVDNQSAQVKPLEVTAIGVAGEVYCAEDSWLLLRVGDDPAELDDNRGSYQVRIQAGAR